MAARYGRHWAFSDHAKTMNEKRDSLPHKPRLHQSYQLLPVPDTDEIQLQSDGRTLRLIPCNSSRLLGDLIALLDGTHTIHDILREMSQYDESQVMDSLHTLYQALLLEDADAEIELRSSDQQQFYASQLTFFSQFANQPYSFQAQLDQSRVTVLGLGSIGSLLLVSLADNGVRDLVGVDFRRNASDKAEHTHEELKQQCRNRNPWASYSAVTLTDNSAELIAGAAQGSQLIIAATDTQDDSLLEKVNEACLETDTVWLPTGIRAWQGYVGPSVFPRKTACYKCYKLRMEANLVHYEPYLLSKHHVKTGEQRIFGHLPQFHRVIADIVAIEVVKLLTNFSLPTTRGRVLTVDFLTLDTEFHEVLKLPRCPACGEPSQQSPMMRPWSM